MGPRGLSILERVLEHAHRLPDGVRLHVDVVDPGECGQGAHPSMQPDHLLINTVASQVTMFAPASVAARATGGPSLVEWARQSGYRRFGRRFFRVGDESGHEITEFDHLPRSLLGEYLAWVYAQIVALLPERVTLCHHRTRATDVAPRAGGDGYTVVLENGQHCHADFVVLAMGHGRRAPTSDDRAAAAFVDGHGRRNPALRFVACPYPVEQLAGLDAQATVAIQGFGLTAHDVISQLTVGRGGQFVATSDGLRYAPSGREPRMLLFSRQCLPFAARGLNQKGLTGRHPARFFTPQAVENVRAATGEARLDFQAHVMPLIVREMAFAYRMAVDGRGTDPDAFVPTEAEQRAVHGILWPLEGRQFASQAAFEAYFDGLVADDLAQARRGNLRSPVKAATDVLRDTREALRAAVEFGGLTPGSHRHFAEVFNAVTNRISFGPPMQRVVELLALRKAGVLGLGGGPGAHVGFDEDTARFRIDTPWHDGIGRQWADVLVTARLDAWSPLTDDATLTARLLERGLIRPYRNGDYHPGGIDIDRHLRPFGADGQVRNGLWAVGFVVEGVHFYTHALPRPQIPSRQTADADQCVLQLMRELQEGTAVEASLRQASDATEAV
ncbi:hypothetical protein CY652_13715 [Burkholderia sp. WAC0059]|nr:hypothetical protein CY652_13715 [Burkholderia sp. WAC0059]